MTKVTPTAVKELRDRTSISMGLCKEALEASDGEVEKALEWLRLKGSLKAEDIRERETKHGAVASYIHTNRRLGALIQVACETDFVAKSEAFVDFCQDLAMHVAAANPLFLNGTEDEIARAPFWFNEDIELITRQFEEDAAMQKKPEALRAKILAGKVQKRIDDFALLKQPFVKEAGKTIENLRTDIVQKLGENIRVVRFERWAV